MDKIILGIDPGLRITGFSVLKLSGTTPFALDLGFLDLKKVESIPDRLLAFENFLIDKLVSHSVNCIALETPFLGKNARTFLTLGYLRGIMLLTAKKHNLEVFEFAPTTVKVSVTGYGAASKEQVARTIGMFFPQILKLKQTAVSDVTDALAVGLCGLWSIEKCVSTQKLLFTN